MLDLNLEEMSLKDLKELHNQLTKAIGSFEDRKKKQALAELEEKARALGFSLAELTGVSAPRKRAPASAKYVNPDDSSETWSGRGRKPRWFAVALEAGKSPEDMAA